MEYLMTYGWAILIIAIVLVAFFSLNLFNPYTFSPKASPGSCQILRPNGPGSNIFVSAVGPTCTTNEIPQYVASFNGRAYILDSNAILPTNPPVTITAWIDPNQNSGGSGITGWGNPTCGGDIYALFLGTSPILLDAGVGCPGVGSGLSPKINTWNFVAVATNSVGETFYLDNSIASNDIASSDLISPANFTIGATYYESSGPASVFAGQIANIQVYNTSLSSSQVSALYAEGLGGAPIDLQHLVGWWPLNGNANDYSGNGNNGVPTNVIFTSSWENGYTAP